MDETTAIRSAGLSVEQQRERYWRYLMPLLPELDDWELSLLGILLFKSGPGAPGTWVHRNMEQMCSEIGRLRGRGPVKRQVLSRSATRLIERGLLQRRHQMDPEYKASWRLLAPAPSTSSPAWPGFYSFNARLWRRQFNGPGVVRAAISRLSFQLDASGQWSGPIEDLGRALVVKSPITAKKRVMQFGQLENELLFEEDWSAGQYRLHVRPRKEKAASPEQLAERRRALREQLHYPELVDQAIAKAGRLLVSGKISLSREVHGFYEPVAALQERFDNPPLIKYSLEQTLSSNVFKGVPGKKSTAKWHHYALRVAENNRWRYPKGSDPKVEIVGGAEPDQLRERELAVRQLLTSAAQLNGTGSRDQARELLPKILKNAPDLVELFESDRSRCETALHLAFKQGSTDFASVKPDPYAADYLPEWSPQ